MNTLKKGKLICYRFTNLLNRYVLKMKVYFKTNKLGEYEMNLNKVKLKIKAISLADEAKTIKRLEKGCVDKYGTNPIYLHRVIDVRDESRATNLARAYIAGKEYRKTEPSRKPCKEYKFEKIKGRLYTLVLKYGDRSCKAKIDNWLSG